MCWLIWLLFFITVHTNGLNTECSTQICRKDECVSQFLRFCECTVLKCEDRGCAGLIVEYHQDLSIKCRGSEACRDLSLMVGPDSQASFSVHCEDVDGSVCSISNSLSTNDSSVCETTLGPTQSPHSPSLVQITDAFFDPSGSLIILQFNTPIQYFPPNLPFLQSLSPLQLCERVFDLPIGNSTLLKLTNQVGRADCFLPSQPSDTFEIRLDPSEVWSADDIDALFRHRPLIFNNFNDGISVAQPSDPSFVFPNELEFTVRNTGDYNSPSAVISGNTGLAECMDLFLDSLNSQWSGPQSLSFSWSIQLPNTAVISDPEIDPFLSDDGKLLSVPFSQLSEWLSQEFPQQITVNLTVSTAFGTSDTASEIIQISTLERGIRGLFQNDGTIPKRIRENDPFRLQSIIYLNPFDIECYIQSALSDIGLPSDIPIPVIEFRYSWMMNGRPIEVTDIIGDDLNSSTITIEPGRITASESPLNITVIAEPLSLSWLKVEPSSKSYLVEVLPNSVFAKITVDGREAGFRKIKIKGTGDSTLTLSAEQSINRNLQGFDGLLFSWQCQMTNDPDFTDSIECGSFSISNDNVTASISFDDTQGYIIFRVTLVAQSRLYGASSTDTSQTIFIVNPSQSDSDDFGPSLSPVFSEASLNTLVRFESELLPLSNLQFSVQCNRQPSSVLWSLYRFTDRLLSSFVDSVIPDLDDRANIQQSGRVRFIKDFNHEGETITIANEDLDSVGMYILQATCEDKEWSASLIRVNPEPKILRTELVQFSRVLWSNHQSNVSLARYSTQLISTDKSHLGFNDDLFEYQFRTDENSDWMTFSTGISPRIERQIQPPSPASSYRICVIRTQSMIGRVCSAPISSIVSLSPAIQESITDDSQNSCVFADLYSYLRREMTGRKDTAQLLTLTQITSALLSSNDQIPQDTSKQCRFQVSVSEQLRSLETLSQAPNLLCPHFTQGYTSLFIDQSLNPVVRSIAQESRSLESTQSKRISRLLHSIINDQCISPVTQYGSISRLSSLVRLADLILPDLTVNECGLFSEVENSLLSETVRIIQSTQLNEYTLNSERSLYSIYAQRVPQNEPIDTNISLDQSSSVLVQSKTGLTQERFVLTRFTTLPLSQICEQQSPLSDRSHPIDDRQLSIIADDITLFIPEEVDLTVQLSFQISESVANADDSSHSSVFCVVFDNSQRTWISRFCKTSVSLDDSQVFCECEIPESILESSQSIRFSVGVIGDDKSVGDLDYGLIAGYIAAIVLFTSLLFWIITVGLWDELKASPYSHPCIAYYRSFVAVMCAMEISLCSFILWQHSTDSPLYSIDRKRLDPAYSFCFDAILLFLLISFHCHVFKARLIRTELGCILNVMQSLIFAAIIVIQTQLSSNDASDLRKVLSVIVFICAFLLIAAELIWIRKNNQLITDSEEDSLALVIHWRNRNTLVTLSVLVAFIMFVRAFLPILQEHWDEAGIPEGRVYYIDICLRFIDWSVILIPLATLPSSTDIIHLFGNMLRKIRTGAIDSQSETNEHR